MCGISGFFGRTESNAVRKNLDLMQQSLCHRGPDSHGGWDSFTGEESDYNFIGFRHNRLAINDLDTRANQPLVGKNGSRIIVNGEIYNSPEIRKNLKDYNFRTNSDSESLLAILDTYGLAGLKMIDGMFAFAYKLPNVDRIWIGRDPVGIKPLYWSRDLNGFWFASEASPLAKLLGKKISQQGLSEWSMYQFQVSERTFYEDVYCVKPGTVLEISSAGETCHSFWDINDFLQEKDSGNSDILNLHEKLREVQNKSVTDHLLADVEIATYLSGGMDSSWVSSCAAEKGVRRAYVGRYLESGYDETTFAKLVADKSNLNLSVVDIDEEAFFSALHSFGRNMDFPTAGPGAIGQYILAREVSREFRVILSGTGGDELFLGYTRDRFPLLAMGLIESAKGISNSWRSISGDISGLSGYSPMLTKFAESGGFTSPLDGFLGIADRTDAVEGIFEVNADLRESIRNELKSYIDPIGYKNMNELQNVLLRYEVGKFLPSLLQVEDRVTMTHGLEARVPLLSKNMLQFLLPLSLQQRMFGSKPKDLMRAAASGLIPIEVIERKDKMGFPVPLGVWANGAAKASLLEVLSQLRDRNLPFVRNNLLEKIIKDDDLGNRNLWACISLGAWLNSIDGLEIA
jgi:asparagine synthase (glutamine-hydrolysing)